MNPSTKIKVMQRQWAYYMWVGVFFLILFTVIFGLYYSTQKIDYVWRWYRVPQYFFFHDEVEVRADADGEVVDVVTAGEETTVRIRSGDDVTAFTAPIGNVLVDQGTIVFPGDLIMTYRQWKVGILLQGLWLTLKVSSIAIVFGILIGLFTGLARIADNPALKWSAVVYIELIRGSPLLVQIFIWYFVLGTLINKLLALQGFFQVPPIYFGVAALAFFTGAYVAEIVRAGIQSIHRGQMEASRSLGMTYAQSMAHVILPQALRRIIPPLAGQFISLIKDSSLLGIIAIRELTKATREVVTTSLQPFELWFICALLYLLMTFSLSMLLQYLERRALAT